jgi:1-acyl-sn-glycerol-3-phosphate acyltransferase
LICNHISHFDPAIVAGVVWKKVAWVVAKDMYAHPAGAYYFNNIDAICVDRESSDRRAVKEMLRRFKKGESVGLYPEGGIRSGETSILGGQPVDEAVGGFAQLAKVPVVPAILVGADKLYCRSAWKWRTTVDIAFGEAIYPAGLSRGEITQKTGEAMRKLAQELKDAYGLTDDDFPKTAQERWAEDAKR